MFGVISIIYTDKIKVKHVYFVDFNPKKGNEFDNKHLAVVLKKNSHDNTLMVLPLTSKKDFRGKSIKIHVHNLTEKRYEEETHAIFNKIRTVSNIRFTNIMDTGVAKNAYVDDDTFKKLVYLSTKEIESSLSIDEKLDFYREKHDEVIQKKIIDLAFLLINARKNVDVKKEKCIVTEFAEIIYNNIKFLYIDNYNFSKQQINSGVDKIIKELLKDKQQLTFDKQYDII